MRYRFQAGETVYEISVEREGETLQMAINGETFPVEVLDHQAGQISLRFAGRPVTLYWAGDGSAKWISFEGCTYRLDKPSPRHTRSGAEGGAGEAVRAPMPAQVRLVQVAEGDAVEKGQTLLLLEAMKMEIRIKAPVAGKVLRVLTKAGQAVDRDQVLIEMGD